MNAFPLSMIPSSPWKTPFNDQKSLIHGGDYNPEQWLSDNPAILQEDAELMQKTGINSVTIGVFSWSALEPSEGKFDFSWMDRVMDQQAQLGHRVILSTPTAAMPAWLAEKYPQVRRVDPRGYRPPMTNRQHHCWTSPIFRQRVQIINTELANRYARHPALAMWHVSNELCGQCFCELCRQSWCDWLERRFGSLQAMNQAHWACFWSKQATEWKHAEPTCGYSDGLLLNWLRFCNDQYAKWYQFEADILRRITPSVPITTNFMCTVYGINYQSLARVVDVVADDQYPNYDPQHPLYLKAIPYWSLKQDLYRCMKPGHTFMLMESCPGVMQSRTPMKVKRPGIHRLEMIQAIAHGADGTCYFQFRSGRGGMEKLHGAVVEHWGAQRHLQTRRFRELRELSDTYEKIKPILGTSVCPQVALIYDSESSWAQQLTPGLGIDNPPRNTNLREIRYYDAVAAEYYEPFWRHGIPVDVIPNDRDLSAYRIVVLPMHWIMTPDFSRRLKKYVNQGGILIATWDTAMADEHNRMLMGGWPGEGLTEVFGGWVEEVDRVGNAVPIAIEGLPGSGSEVATLMHTHGTEVLARFAQDFYRGMPAVTRFQYGQGQAYYIGTRLDAQARHALFERIFQDSPCHIPFKDPLPEGVTVQWRGVGKRLFAFAMNFSSRSHTLALGSWKLADMETQTVYENHLPMEPLQARVFEVS